MQIHVYTFRVVFLSALTKPRLDQFGSRNGLDWIMDRITDQIISRNGLDWIGSRNGLDHGSDHGTDHGSDWIMDQITDKK